MRDDGEADAERFDVATQEADIAAAAVAEGEIGTAGEVGGADAVVEDFGDEITGLDAGEVAVERELIEKIDALGVQGGGAFGFEGEAERRVVRAEEFARVGREAEDSAGLVRPGLVGGLQDFEMAPVDPVEIAEGDGGAARFGWQIAPIGEDTDHMVASWQGGLRGRQGGMATPVAVLIRHNRNALDWPIGLVLGMVVAAVSPRKDVACVECCGFSFC